MDCKWFPNVLSVCWGCVVTMCWEGTYWLWERLTEQYLWHICSWRINHVSPATGFQSTWKIRRGVKWHSGNGMSAKAAVCLSETSWYHNFFPFLFQIKGSDLFFSPFALQKQSSFCSTSFFFINHGANVRENENNEKCSSLNSRTQSHLIKLLISSEQ